MERSKEFKKDLTKHEQHLLTVEFTLSEIRGLSREFIDRGQSKIINNKRLLEHDNAVLGYFTGFWLNIL